MDATKLFDDALKYPTKDWNKLLILGVLLLIAGIYSVLRNFGFLKTGDITTGLITLIFSLIAIIFTLFVSGYCLNITRKTINLEEYIPEFELVKNFVDGLKVLVLGIVYMIIPIVVTVIFVIFAGTFAFITQASSYITNYGTSTIPQLPPFYVILSFLILLLIVSIFYIIFILLLNIATAKLAETDSLAEAINMLGIFNKIGEIGWGNYAIWIIVYGFISFVILIIMSIINLIPFIGIIVGLLLISPYMQMFRSRALGLLYNESKQ
ncbi:MAG: DUF4013 domain-containing protein [Methanobacteriaceae archaeon]|jgi:hypothetical protein|nr:DUF4013 domain-containing protein [Candidatus Methanorudis spinitermitis]